MSTGSDGTLGTGTPGELVLGTRVGAGTLFPVFPNSKLKKQEIEKVYLPPPTPGKSFPVVPATPDIEWLPELPDRLAEPFVAVIPAIGGQRLVHLTVARKTRRELSRRPRSRRPRSRRAPGPFTLANGSKVPHLPRYDLSTPRVTPDDVVLVAKEHPDYAVPKFVLRFGVGEFVQQVERARAFLRGSVFWKLRPRRGGYAAYGLKHGAEKNAGKYLGYVSEIALVVAAILDGLKTKPYARGEKADVFR